MKILLSAYACEPNAGSESGVGWHWAIELTRLGHEVLVLTAACQRPLIERELASNPRNNLQFRYYALPKWPVVDIKDIRPIHLHYLLWQWRASRFARRLHREIGFDCVHHVTYAAIRQPSFMGGLGVPFIFGPVGGGERAPWKLRKGFGWKAFAREAVRDVSTALIRFDPLMRRTFRQAEAIYVTTQESRAAVPRRWRSNTQVQLAIGIDRPLPATEPSTRRPSGNLRVLYVGNFLPWKGMHLGLIAFSHLNKQFPATTLTLVGGGTDEKHWRRTARALGIDGAITWLPWTDHNNLTKIYLRHDVLLFPGLHDSGGIAVLEAMAHGLPVVCLDLGGPAVTVDRTCGRVVRTKGKTKSQVERDVAEALAGLHEDPALLRRLSRGARRRVGAFSWRNQVESIYSRLESAVTGPTP